MARGIETHNGYVVQNGVDRITIFPSTDPAYYGRMHASKVGSSTYLVTKGVNPTFIWQAQEDVNDSDYMQMRTEDGIRSVFRAKGTQWTGFCNLGAGVDKGMFVITGANLGVLASGIPANLQNRCGDGSGVVIVASDNINKAVVMYYVAATKKLTFRNSDNEVNELTLA